MKRNMNIRKYLNAYYFQLQQFHHHSRKASGLFKNLAKSNTRAGQPSQSNTCEPAQGDVLQTSTNALAWSCEPQSDAGHWPRQTFTRVKAFGQCNESFANASIVCFPFGKLHLSRSLVLVVPSSDFLRYHQGSCANL